MGSSGSAQSPQYAQLLNLYNYFAVLACKVVVRGSQETSGATTNTSSTLVVAPHTTATLAQNNDRIASQRYAKSAIMNTSLSKCFLKSYLSTSQYVGVTPQQAIVDDVYHGSTGADPSFLWYFIVSFQGTHPTDATTASVIIDITQYAVLFRPLTQS